MCQEKEDEDSPALKIASMHQYDLRRLEIVRVIKKKINRTISKKQK